MKNHRSKLAGWWWQQSPGQFKVAETILMLAAWQDCVIDFFGQAFDLKRGQLLKSVREIGKVSGTPKSTVTRTLNALVNREFLIHETVRLAGQRCTLLTILNYERYQAKDDPPETRCGTSGETPNDERAGHHPGRPPGHGAGHFYKKLEEREEENNNIYKAGARVEPKLRPKPKLLAKRAIEYLNLKTGAQYNHEEFAVLRLFDVIASKFHTLEHVKAVIDAKTSEWLNHPKYHRALKPSVLFPIDNFSKYHADCQGKLPPPTPPNGTPLTKPYELGGGEIVLQRLSDDG